MKRIIVLSICLFAFSIGLFAQQNKLIKELESKHGALQKMIAETETLLKNTKKTVSSQLNSLSTLTSQITQRKKYINTINEDVIKLNREINTLDRQLAQLKKELQDKKKKYEASVQYLYRNRSIQERLLFILSADNRSQTYRRMR